MSPFAKGHDNRKEHERKNILDFRIIFSDYIKGYEELFGSLFYKVS